jgi:hypothetical protein
LEGKEVYRDKEEEEEEEELHSRRRKKKKKKKNCTVGEGRRRGDQLQRWGRNSEL